jgi:hypothetical protein
MEETKALLQAATWEEVKDVALANGGKQLYLVLPGQNFLRR